MTPCIRCVTPTKCANYGCCPGTWPAERIDLRATICMIARAILKDSSLREWPVTSFDLALLRQQTGDATADRINGLRIRVDDSAPALPRKKV